MNYRTTIKALTNNKTSASITTRKLSQTTIQQDITARKLLSELDTLTKNFNELKERFDQSPHPTYQLVNKLETIKKRFAVKLDEYKKLNLSFLKNGDRSLRKRIEPLQSSLLGMEKSIRSAYKITYVYLKLYLFSKQSSITADEKDTQYLHLTPNDMTNSGESAELKETAPTPTSRQITQFGIMQDTSKQNSTSNNNTVAHNSYDTNSPNSPESSSNSDDYSSCCSKCCCKGDLSVRSA